MMGVGLQPTLSCWTGSLFFNYLSLLQGQLPSPLRQAGSELEGINTDWKIDLSQDKKRKTQGMERGPCQKVKKKKVN